MEIMSIVTIVAGVILLLGLLLGLVRGWKKSLAKTLILIVNIVLSIVFAPILGSALVGKFTNGTTVQVASFRVDFLEIIKSIVGESGASDLSAATETTQNLARALMNLAVNIAAFLILFIFIGIIATIIYWIASAAVKSSQKKNGTLKEKGIGNRAIGGGIGLIGGLVFLFALFIPVFGVMNICDKLIEEETTNESASAYAITAPLNTIAAKHYYTENEKIGKVETYVEKYAEFKEKYNKSIVGSVFNFTKINKVGELSFERLTNVKSGNLTLDFKNEIVSAIRTYNAFKNTFIENTFDVTNNNSIDGALTIYKEAVKSETIRQYVIDLVPTLCARWSNGESFMGINLPVDNKYKDLVISILNVFNVSQIEIINNNVEVIGKTIKKINDPYQIIKKVKNGENIVDVLTDCDGAVKDIIIELSKSQEFRRAIPITLNNVMELVYEIILENEIEFTSTLTNEEIDKLNWEGEATKIQNIITNFLNIYNSYVGGASDATNLADKLENIGDIIDSARTSKLLGPTLKVVIRDYLTSNKLGLDENTRNKIEEYINNNWETEDYSFKEVFKTIQETINVVTEIVNEVNNISLESLETIIVKITENETVKNTIKDLIIGEDGIIKQVVGEDSSNSQSIEVMTDLLETFIDNSTAETVHNDILAASEIVNVVSNSLANENHITLNGETNEEKQQSADDLVDKIVNSNAIMMLLETAESSSDSALNEIIGNLDGEVSFIKDSISNLDEADPDMAAKKAVLESLFNL
ncbi:MAG: hypothetical protein IJ538_02870 [Clostridia bacterium]|nr:hypothetical protein [Clostridia bacterium]